MVRVEMKRANEMNKPARGEKIKIVFMKNGREKILEKMISPHENHAGIVSLEKTKKEIKFTVRILNAKHIHYSFDPKTQKFEVRFFQFRKDKHNVPAE